MVAAEGPGQFRAGISSRGFNGAAAWWPRKGQWLHVMAGTKIALQWGRGLVAAEGLSSSAHMGRPDKLQWGRGLVAAEGGEAINPWGLVQGLQWGRGLVAAEGGRLAHDYARGRRFNGAAAWWPRKAARSGSDTQRRCRLQWGRGLVAAEGRAWFRRIGRGRVGFNGAAAWWPRKARRRRWIASACRRFNGAAAWWPRKGQAGKRP